MGSSLGHGSAAILLNGPVEVKLTGGTWSLSKTTHANKPQRKQSEQSRQEVVPSPFSAASVVYSVVQPACAAGAGRSGEAKARIGFRIDS